MLRGGRGVSGQKMVKYGGTSLLLLSSKSAGYNLLALSHSNDRATTEPIQFIAFSSGSQHTAKRV